MRLDMTLACRHEIDDQELTNKRLEGLTDAIYDVCRSLGAKIKKKENRPKKMIDTSKLSLKNALMVHGGKGVVLE